jgi:hypothetical protein
MILLSFSIGEGFFFVKAEPIPGSADGEAL